jgi:hypothetical protein
VRPLALRVENRIEERAAQLVVAFCEALVAGDRESIEAMFAREYTWLGQPGAWVELEAFENVRRVPPSILVAIELDHPGFLFLVDMTKSGRTVTACVSVGEDGSAIERVFDPEPLVRSLTGATATTSVG